MQKKFWISLALLLVIPGLLFTASCAKKTVKSEASVSEMPKSEMAKETAAAAVKEDTSAADKARAEAEALEKQRMEAERLRKLEEERLKAQQLREAQLEQERREAEIAKYLEEAKKNVFLTELVQFDFDSSVLTAMAQDRLKRKAGWLKEHEKASVIIEGHCDERGSNEYNLALGWRRAEAAKAFLVDLGISATRMSTISYGEERPFEKGKDESAWSQNRRAHFVLE
ncbi:MAG: peptidoglycan-associated lipoprotein Pal [Desulfobacterales bacterium]|nr:peptidoglycan-associated lipoprotein Pal [Desulfobacterales bacterium]